MLLFSVQSTYSACPKQNKNCFAEVTQAKNIFYWNGEISRILIFKPERLANFLFFFSKPKRTLLWVCLGVLHSIEVQNNCFIIFSLLTLIDINTRTNSGDPDQNGISIMVGTVCNSSVL